MLSGASIIKRGIVHNLLSKAQQTQPCGVDVSLRRVLRWTSPGTLDFDNATRRAAATEEIPFNDDDAQLALAHGAYLVEFNETVRIPRDCIGQLFARYPCGVLVA